MGTPLSNLTYSGVLAASLPTPGRIVYNGYEFPIATSKRFRCVPVYDDAGVGHKGNLWTMAVVFWLSDTSESALANQLQDFSGSGNAGLRHKLTQPGRQLIIEDCGLGDVNIDPNTSGTRDLMWGPKIVDFQLNPAGNLAFEVVWVVEFMIADCLNVTDGSAISKLEQNLLAFGADVEFLIDEDGLTTRSISGYIEVPQMRSDTNHPVRDVEAIFNTITWDTPVGFVRKPVGRRVAADRSRIDFRIVDAEHPSDDAPPEGVTRADITMSLENREASNFYLWTWTLEGTIYHRRGLTRAHGYNQAFLILAAYVARLRGFVLSTEQSLVPEFVRIRRRLMARETSFSFSFLVAMPIDQIIQASGIFEPIPNADWNTWKTSMAPIWAPRGYAGLHVEPLQESIVNICAGGTPSMLSTDNRPSTSPSPVPIFDCSGITASNSWVEYDNQLYGQCYSPGTIHSGTDEQQLDITDSTQADFQAAGATILGKFDRAATLDVQTHGPPILRVLMIGKAKRVNFKADIPAITSVDGQPVVELDRRVDTRQAGAYGNCKVWATKWRILYQVLSQPAAGVNIDRDLPDPHQP